MCGVAMQITVQIRGTYLGQNQYRLAYQYGTVGFLRLGGTRT